MNYRTQGKQDYKNLMKFISFLFKNFFHKTSGTVIKISQILLIFHEFFINFMKVILKIQETVKKFVRYFEMLNFNLQILNLKSNFNENKN